MPGMNRAFQMLMSWAALSACGAAPAMDAARPDVVRWNASSSDMKRALEGRCVRGFVERPIRPPFLPDVKDAQVQIDCDGFDFLGAPRWAEFVFGDDRLQMVWIMMSDGDKDAAVAALSKAYGAASSSNADYVAFAGGHAAWRNKPAEVLFYSPELSSWIDPDFAKDRP
jgi:hypothetical protein